MPTYTVHGKPASRREAALHFEVWGITHDMTPMGALWAFERASAHVDATAAALMRAAGLQITRDAAPASPAPVQMVLA